MPHSPNFSLLFAAAGRTALQAATVLDEILTGGVDLDAKANQLHELERDGDQIAREVKKTLETSFITPFDREDILALTEHADDFIDLIEDAARRMKLYKMQRITPIATAFGKVIKQQAALLAQGLPLIEDSKQTETLRKVASQVRQLEDEGDRLHDEALSSLYAGATDIPGLVEAIRWGEIYNLLEEATDQAQRVVNVVEAVLLTNG